MCFSLRVEKEQAYLAWAVGGRGSRFKGAPQVVALTRRNEATSYSNQYASARRCVCSGAYRQTHVACTGEVINKSYLVAHHFSYLQRAGTGHGWVWSVHIGTVLNQQLHQRQMTSTSGDMKRGIAFVRRAMIAVRAPKTGSMGYDRTGK